MAKMPKTKTPAPMTTQSVQKQAQPGFLINPGAFSDAHPVKVGKSRVRTPKPE